MGRMRSKRGEDSMRDTTGEHMNVARPPIKWKLLGWAGLLFGMVMLYLAIWRPEQMEIESPGERALWVVFFALFVFGAVCLLAYAYGSYYWWDDKRIGYRFLWRKRSMFWDEIQSWRVRKVGDWK